MRIISPSFTEKGHSHDFQKTQTLGRYRIGIEQSIKIRLKRQIQENTK